jgi:hypothetical protein
VKHDCHILFYKQLRKEGRRNEYERHKLQALNQRQKLVSFSNKAMANEVL